jgi:hypothetical protein
MQLAKYSFGTGDRFGLQGHAQLEAVAKAMRAGIELAIVWNKSHREHQIVGTNQQAVRHEADEAVRESGWQGDYHVDADHIGLDTVDLFLDHSDFFTLDVADYIGKKADEDELVNFVNRYSTYTGSLRIPGLESPLKITKEKLRDIAENYLSAVRHAAAIHSHIVEKKGKTPFIIEISMDETTSPQSPEELFFILAAIGEYRIPAQTIAPKFSGRFNKGVDYQGDIEQFSREFHADLCVIRNCIDLFRLPANLKLSVHSGSDKFAIYPGIRENLKKHDAGIHIKTAGTTWLEELTGLAESGEEPLSLVKNIYRRAYDRFDELCVPYSSVIDINRNELPSPATVDSWNGLQLGATIRHDQNSPYYDPNIRQLLHVGYKIAAEYGNTYLTAVKKHGKIIEKHVCDNLFDRHLTPLFL